ncbi:MAG TPA: hypothetical protein VGD27_07795 [Longimicrobiales bacterium]
MQIRVLAAVALLSTVVIASCDQRAPTDPSASPPRAQAAILDGSSGGNPHFFFLSPLVKSPTYSGTFNPNLPAVVEVCNTTAQDASGHCESLLVRFERGSQTGLAVQVVDEAYIAHWRIRDYPIADNTPFRIIVLVGNFQLGYVDLVKRNGGIYNETTDAVVSSEADRTLPLKFRIEQYAFCSSSSIECFEGMLTPAGGTFTLTRADGTKPAGAEFPQNAVQDTYLLKIERYTAGECLPTDAPQYQGCYRFSTEPYIENFQLPATVGVCLFDAAAVPFYNDGQLRLWKWSEKEGDPITELERVTINYLVCPDPNALSARSSSPLMLGAARAANFLFGPLASLLMPSDAYAAAPYEGGKLINFSRIGWVRPLNVQILQGDGQTGLGGQALPIQPKVRVTNKYGMTVQGVAGRVVDFTPSGDGSATPPSTITDLAGAAATTWTLSTESGANTLLARTPTSRAIAPTPYQAEAVFNANGVAVPTGVQWLPLIGPTWDGTSGYVSPLITPRVVITSEGKLVANIAASLGSDSYAAMKKIMDFQHSRTYRVAVQVAGVTISYVDIYRGTASKKLYNSATNQIVADITISQDFVMRFRLVE